MEAARTQRKLGKTELADAAYRALLNRFPKPKNLDKILDEWAALHFDAKDFNRADEIFRRIVQDTPDSDLADNARLSLAESDMIAGRFDQSRQSFEALASDLKSDAAVQETALTHLVEIDATKRNWKEVLASGVHLVEKFPNTRYRFDTQFRIAEAHLQLEQLDESRRILTALQGLNDQELRKAAWYPRVWILLAEIAFRQKQYDEALKTLDAFRASHADSSVAYQADDLLGRIYKNQADFEKARTAFERVIDDRWGRRTETAAKCQFFIAETYLMQKDFHSAQREYFKVVHLYKFPDWQAPPCIRLPFAMKPSNSGKKLPKAIAI